MAGHAEFQDSPELLHPARQVDRQPYPETDGERHQQPQPNPRPLTLQASELGGQRLEPLVLVLELFFSRLELRLDTRTASRPG